MRSLCGACSPGREDLRPSAAVAGRMSGRAVGHLILFSRQMDDILEQTTAKKVLQLRHHVENALIADSQLENTERSSSKEKGMTVHTERGPSVIDASLWPCLNTPSSKEKVMSQQNVKISGTDHIKKLGSTKEGVYQSSMVHIDNSGVDWEGLMFDDYLKGTASDDRDVINENWSSPKKKGRRNKIIEPPVATTKSSRIQNQGILMEEKASRLKSIQNLELPAMDDPHQKGGEIAPGRIPDKF